MGRHHLRHGEGASRQAAAQLSDGSGGETGDLPRHTGPIYIHAAGAGPIARGKSEQAPSLDRIHPKRGYVPDNVRVISDRANRLKGDRSLNEIKRLAEQGPPEFRTDYQMIATYMERELLLDEVREKAKQEGRAGEEWAKIAFFLDRVFRKSLIKEGGPLA